MEVVERRRVIQQLHHAPIALLEAPGGYGKTIVCAQLATALDIVAARAVLRAPVGVAGLLAQLALGLRRAGLAPLAETLTPEDPDGALDHLLARLRARRRDLLLVVDEVHRAAPDAAGWLRNLAEDLPGGVRLMIAGRRLGGALAGLAVRGATVLGVPALRFDDEEIAAVLAAARQRRPEQAEVEDVVVATERWPAAVALAARLPAAAPSLTERRRDRDPTPSAPVGTGLDAVLRRLVDGLLAAAPDVRALLAAAVELPLLSADVLAILGGPGALDRLLDAGLPIRFRADGWGELPDPVRELFAGGGRLAVAALQAVAATYAQHGELAEGATLLQRHGDHAGVVALLGGQRREALERAGLPLLHATVDAVPYPLLAAAPALLVTLVRAAEGQPRLRRTFLERARRLVADGGGAARALAAEEAVDAARADDLVGPVASAERILAQAGDDELVTRGRVLAARARCLLLRDMTGAAATSAGEDLEQAVALFRLAGEPGWEAQALQTLGHLHDFFQGRFALAVERIERALALRSAAGVDRATTLTFLCEVLAHAGRLDDAEVAILEASTIGRRLGDEQLLGYAAWSASEVACQRRDRPAAEAALAEAQAHPGSWFQLPAGIDFLAHAAEVRATLGDAEGARRDLDRARERERYRPTGALLAAEARFEATFGDPATAWELLDALDSSPLAYPRDRCVRLLLRAVCAARRDDAREAATLVARAREAAGALGDPLRLERREPELLAAAVPGRRAAPAPAAARVVLLGGFAVERAGSDASPPPGRPSMLVKLLALRPLLTSDEAIDALWPDVDLGTGRARLRNVLNRVRAASGQLVDRTESALRLAAGVEVDATRFEQDAAAALQAPPEERAGLARGALARYTGDLLPADRALDWTTGARERLRRRHLALLDVVADDAIARNELEEACRLLEVAIAAGPLEEVRYVRLARALLAQSRPRRARAVVAAGLATAAELGARPGAELSALRAGLGERLP